MHAALGVDFRLKNGYSSSKLAYIGGGALIGFLAPIVWTQIHLTGEETQALAKMRPATSTTVIATAVGGICGGVALYTLSDAAPIK